MANQFTLRGQVAEEILKELVERSYLTDWCFANPRLPDGKELCDVLVLFDDTAIIFQAKNLKLDQNGRYNISEVEKNLRQLAGARRSLMDLRTPIRTDHPWRQLEATDIAKIREVYMVSALLGEGEAVFSFAEEFKKRTIHVMPRAFLQIALRELDTIADLTEYLRKKEALLRAVPRIMITGGEEELLAWYLSKNRSFDELLHTSAVMIEAGRWSQAQRRPEWLARKKEDELSYGWDEGIIARAHEAGQAYEPIARELARPNRLQRRMLSKSFFEAHVRAHDVAAGVEVRRVLPWEWGVTWCFLFTDDPYSAREIRRAKLSALCHVARGKYPVNHRVVGIATETKMAPECSYDFCLYEKEEWTEEDQKLSDEIQNKAGYLVNSIGLTFQEDEYPGT